MNTGSASDGFIHIYMDGKKVVNLDKVHLRKSDNVKFHSIILHNYWGGSTIDWAPPKDTPIKFKNVNVYCGGGAGTSAAPSSESEDAPPSEIEDASEGENSKEDEDKSEGEDESEGPKPPGAKEEEGRYGIYQQFL